MAQCTDHFDQLYRRDADPWQVRTRWYEQRKQALVLAALPDRRYARAFETACGTGALTAELAGRCDVLLACDGSATAVEIARRHVAETAGERLSIEQRTLPGDWPEGRFDLVVVAEWAYYLSEAELVALLQACHASLTDEGCLVACHWRPDFPDRCHPTADLHARLGQGPGWHRLVHHEEADFLLDVWSPLATSVACRPESSPTA